MLLLIRKDTKQKAIHNLKAGVYKEIGSCCLYAKILNRKQFTTWNAFKIEDEKLLLIRKDTKQKAIHNCNVVFVNKFLLLLIRKDTKQKAIHNFI